MIFHFCPACWSDTPALAEACPQCGADLKTYLELTMEGKYLLALRHPASDIRIIAAWSLGELGSDKAFSEFERMLMEEKEYDVLREVVSGLAIIPGSQARELLAAVQAHPYPVIAQLAKSYVARHQDNKYALSGRSGKYSWPVHTRQTTDL